MPAQSSQRITAVALKDAAELVRNPGAIVPAVMMVFGSLFPAFLVVVGVPLIEGESLEGSGEFVDAAMDAVPAMPELSGLSGEALIQSFIFHQFALLILLVPVVASMALATHAVIGEKQSKALEPLLATPISTIELLAAKTLTPFLFAFALTWIAVALYVTGMLLVSEPGVAQSFISVRTLIMFGLLGPLIELAALQLSVIVSSRANDPRSAQQMASLMILPITVVFVAQLMGAYVVDVRALLLGALGCVVVNGILILVGVRVFDRESILTRWK